MPLNSAELLRRFSISNSIRNQVYDADLHAMLHLAFAELVERTLPARVLLEIFSDVL